MPASPTFPMFPLPNFFLFPGTAVPLHIFEERYRQMVTDILDGQGRIVMAAIAEGYESESLGSPPVFEVGGLGEIVQHRELDDGRYVIVLAGIARVRIREVSSDRLYRMAAVDVIEEAEPPGGERLSGDTTELETRLVEAIQRRIDQNLELPDDLSLGQLADLLLHRLPLEQSAMQRLFADADPRRRAEGALAADARID